MVLTESIYEHNVEAGYVSATTVGDYKVYFVTHNITNDCSGKILDIPIVYNIVEDPGETTFLFYAFIMQENVYQKNC
jgi:hypothetical protein